MIRIFRDPDHEMVLFFSRSASHANVGGGLCSLFELVSRSDNDYDHPMA